MFYKRTESYRFSMPREHKAYVAFKDRLKEMGIKFLEEGGHTEGTISVVTRGNFEVDDKCDIWTLTR